MQLGARLKRFNRVLGSRVRSVGPALFQILQAFRQVSVYQAFRRERDFPVFNARLQDVANLHIHPLADVLGDDDLEFVLYSDDIHRTFGLTDAQFDC